VIEPALALDQPAWVVSNHDFGRAATHFGPGHERLVALLLLTLPGLAFVYQGDEIGMVEGPGHDPPLDRFGRDRMRHPMQWDATRHGGFTTGEPWLPAVDPGTRNVAAQERDRGSLLWLYRDLLALRRELRGDARFFETAPGTLAYARGDEHVVAVNCAAEPRPAPAAGELRLSTSGARGGPAPERLGPSEGFIASRS
jgi:alpha-glucosidase